MLISCIIIIWIIIQISPNQDDDYITNHESTILSIIQHINEDSMLNYIEDLVQINDKHDKSRLTGTEGCEETKEYILNELVNLGIDTKIHNWTGIGKIEPYQNTIFESQNIEGILPSNRDNNQSIILMAHYDTVAETGSADDNSAGVAAILSIAKVLRKYEFNYEIRFLLVSGEEEGLLGSSAYAMNSYQTNDSIFTVINLDMIGYSDSEIENDEFKVRIYETCSNHLIDDIFILCKNPIYSSYINFEVIGSNTDAYHVSDHRSFCNFGYDSIFIHEYTWNYNKDTKTDLIEKLDIDYATRVARLAAAFVTEYNSTLFV